MADGSKVDQGMSEIGQVNDGGRKRLGIGTVTYCRVICCICKNIFYKYSSKVMLLPI